MVEKPWVEKYRPKRLDEIVGQTHVVQRLKKYVEKGIRFMPHLLFHGRQGTGKTATAYALANELDVEIVEFNASHDRGIDFIRDTIGPLLETAEPKIILLDEADALTPNAQGALRRMMEEALRKTENRIILTCNYVSKIIPPIRSRCADFKFRPLSKEDCIKVLVRIIKQEGIVSEIASSMDELKNLLEYLVELSRGDLRIAINKLQDIYMGGQKLTKEIIEQQFIEVKLAKEIVKSALDGNWEQALDQLRTYIIMGDANGKELLHELGLASEVIQSPVLRQKFLFSLKLADLALTNPDTSPYIQLAEAVLALYVYAHAVPKDQLQQPKQEVNSHL